MHFASSNSSLPDSIVQLQTIAAEDRFPDLHFYGGSALADPSNLRPHTKDAEDADPEEWMRIITSDDYQLALLGDPSTPSVYYNSATAYDLRPPQKSQWAKSMVAQHPSADKVRLSAQTDRSLSAMACSSSSRSTASTITTATDCSSRNSVSMSPSVSSSSTIRSSKCSSTSPGDGLLSHHQELVSCGRFVQRIGTTAGAETMEIRPPAVQRHRDDRLRDHPKHMPVYYASSYRHTNNGADGVSRSSEESRGFEDASDHHHRFHQRRHRRIIGRHQGSHDATEAAFLVEPDGVLLSGSYDPIDHSAESHPPADIDGGCCRFAAVVDDCRRADVYYGSFQRNLSTSGRHSSLDWTEIIASHESSDFAASVRQFISSNRHEAAAADSIQLDGRRRPAHTRYNAVVGDENGSSKGNRISQPVSAAAFVKHTRRQIKLQSGDGFVTSSSSSNNRRKLKQKIHALDDARSLQSEHDECVSEISDPPCRFEATQRHRSAAVSGRSIDYDLLLKQIRQGVKQKSGKSSRQNLRGGVTVPSGSFIRDNVGEDGLTEASFKQIESNNLLAEKIRGGVTEASGSEHVCGVSCRKDMTSMASTMTEIGGRAQLESYAIAKCSDDPKQDFKQSMVEMIVEKELQGSYDLMELLQCYLTLNSDSYHNTIVRAFAEVWTEFIVHHHRNRDRDRANAAHSFRRSGWSLAAGESLPENHSSIDD